MTGKRVFITGGASGLGRATALRFARGGYRVCIGDVDAGRAEEVRALLGPEGLYLPCDVTREEDLQQAAATLEARWGGVDVVINNAGVAGAGAIDEVTLADWKWILDINLLGVVRGCRAFVPLLKRQGSGHLVNVASMAGLMDVPWMSSYNASKAAVVSLSETLHHELADEGIRVSVVCPGFFKTRLHESLRTDSPALRQTMSKLADRAVVTSEEIAEQVFTAVQVGKFYVLPHREGRKAWQLKRLLPRSLYTKLIRRQLRGLKRAVMGAG